VRIVSEEAPAQVTQQQEPLSQEVEDVLEALRDVVDPELGINVVDLGLVYGVDVDADKVATLDMTLWSPTSGSTGSGCRRGARRTSPKTAANSSARSASTSDPRRERDAGLLVGRPPARGERPRLRN